LFTRLLALAPAAWPSACWSTSIGFAQAVADAGFRGDVRRRIGALLELLAQLAHIDAEILDIRRSAPDLIEQMLVRDHLASVLHQDAQDAVLASIRVRRCSRFMQSIVTSSCPHAVSFPRLALRRVLCGTASVQRSTRLSRRALVITDTEERLIAAAAIMGESRRPVIG
jgi:hypothetical protein